MDKYEPYDFTEASSNALLYEFTSFGPRGLIKKTVQFQTTDNLYVYNLAFGNKKDDGGIDDQTINNNEDRNKQLATVAAIINTFTKHRPECYVYFSGSTKSRTRLYRIAISLNYNDLADEFSIWGWNEDGKYEMFDSTRSYKGFLIKRK